MGYRIWGAIALGLALLAVTGYWMLAVIRPQAHPETPLAAAALGSGNPRVVDALLRKEPDLARLDHKEVGR